VSFILKDSPLDSNRFGSPAEASGLISKAHSFDPNQLWRTLKSCNNSSSRQRRQAFRHRLYWNREIFHTVLWNSSTRIHSIDPIYTYDRSNPPRYRFGATSGINSTVRTPHWDCRHQLYWNISPIQLCENSIGFHSLDRTHRTKRQDRLNLQEVLVVAVDSVAPEASIQQAGSLIRIAGISCIGIFPYNSVESSRRIF